MASSVIHPHKPSWLTAVGRFMHATLEWFMGTHVPLPQCEVPDYIREASLIKGELHKATTEGDKNLRDIQNAIEALRRAQQYGMAVQLSCIDTGGARIAGLFRDPKGRVVVNLVHFRPAQHLPRFSALDLAEDIIVYDGFLRVQSDEGETFLRAGDVYHIRPGQQVTFEAFEQLCSAVLVVVPSDSSLPGPEAESACKKHVRVAEPVGCTGCV